MTLDEPDLAEDVGARKRAAVVLGVLGIVAAVVVLGLVALLGSSGPKHHGLSAVDVPPLTTSPSASATHSAPPSTTHSSPAQHSSSSTGPVTRTCQSDSPCVLDGDPGGAVAAVNAFRASHGRAPVTGSVTASAGSCALHAGNQPYCPDSYFWEPVSTLSGSAVVSKIAGKSDGTSWLLDPQLTAVVVGWAAVPHGQYECALFAVSGH